MQGSWLLFPKIKWVCRVCVATSLLIFSFAFAHPTHNDLAYRLDAGDQIAITVFGESDLSLQTTLVKGGFINYPYLGTIQASGLTIAELEQLLVAGLDGDFLIDPIVHVTIVEYRPFYIYGQVQHPGSYPYQPNLTVEKAIAIAGGMTERASMAGFKVLRTGVEGEQDFEAQLSFDVLPGDAIYIKESFF